jgi:hypothetical protein
MPQHVKSGAAQKIINGNVDQPGFTGIHINVLEIAGKSVSCCMLKKKEVLE